jgi:hypothetical protein
MSKRERGRVFIVDLNATRPRAITHMAGDLGCNARLAAIATSFESGNDTGLLDSPAQRGLDALACPPIRE